MEGTPPTEQLKSPAVSFGGTIYEGPNHAYIRSMIAREHPEFDEGLRMHTDGFVTSRGRFVNRQEGYDLAEEAQQLSHLSEGMHEQAKKGLHSEDLRL